ncbi:MAG: hypothetical protein RL268_1989 [Pseudomonadota bacterium]|jgi:hypothetical protein
MTRTDREGPIQRAIVSWLKVVLPDAIIHHSPAETRRPGRAGDVERAMNAANGVLPGFPDVFIRTRWGDCYLEVKAPGGSLSASQKAFRDKLAALGCNRFAMVRSIDEARDTLAAWGIQTREAGSLVRLPVRGVVR